MIALLRLLEAPQVPVELLCGVPGGPVDALEHRPRLVAAPVRAGRVEQLEGTELLRGAEVPAAAEILERPVAVEADGRTLGLRQVLDDLDLERLAALASSSAIASARGRSFERSNERSAACCSRILASICSRSAGRQRPRQVVVVVEAIPDGRTDAELRVREDLEHRRGHHVRGAVPHRGEVILGPGRERGGGVLGDLVSVDRHAPKGSAWPCQATISGGCGGRARR